MEEAAEDFLAKTKSVTTDELDYVISQMYSAKKDYETKKLVSTEAQHHLENCKAEVTSLLAKANKSEYVVEGVGKASLIEKLKVLTPQTPEAKAELFKWIKDNMGADGFLTHVSVNYQTLQRLYNEAFASAENPAEFHIPGLEAPQSFTELRFRKS